MSQGDPAVRRHEDQQVGELVAAAGRGEPAAWDALIERYSALVWSIARAHRLNPADAADVTQSVWVKLVENLGRLHQPSAVGGWLAAVTRNECLSFIGHANRVTAVAEGVDQLVMRPIDDIDASLLADERCAALWRAFERLPPQARSLMRLLLIEPRLSYAEIGAALDMPVGSIGPIRQRVLRQLRNSPELAALAAWAS